MFNENIRALRKSKGLSQEELAGRLHVVRQTVSKWEQGLSVPDAELLITLAEILETPVSTLLGETLPEQKPEDLKIIAGKLEELNLQQMRQKTGRQKLLCAGLTAFCGILAFVFIFLTVSESPYLKWDYGNPETAVLGTAFHSLEWLFVRTAPFLFALSAAGAIETGAKAFRKKSDRSVSDN